MRYGAAALVLHAALLASNTAAEAKIVLPESPADKGSPAYKKYRGWVDRALAGSPEYGFGARDAATLARLSGEKKYCELAVRVADEQVTQAEAAIAKGEAPAVAGDSYLEVGWRIADVALTYDICRDSTTPAQQARWSAYAERTLENVWHPSAASWGGKVIPWTGWSIDNPGNNYYSSFLEATMYWGLASENPRWLKLVGEDKLPATFAYVSDLPGGGSREGTGYGTSLGRMFALFNLWRSSSGADTGPADAFAADTIAYWVHATVPTLDRFAPIGDQARVSTPDLYDYQRCLMLEARRFTQDARAQGIASWWLHHISVREMESGFNYGCDLLPAGRDAPEPKERVYVASGTGHLFARTDWSRDAMWLDFSAGTFIESHAHEDQGAFTLFERDWLAVTENIWTHSGIQQGTDTNNVVRFVRAGAAIRQRRSSKSVMNVAHSDPATGEVTVTADLTPAYAHGDGVRMWKRDIGFSNRTLKVHDRFEVDGGVHAVFQVNVPHKPVINGNEAEAGRLRLKVIQPANARLTALDWTKESADEYASGWRIDIEGDGREFIVEMSSAGK